MGVEQQPTCAIVTDSSSDFPFYDPPDARKNFEIDIVPAIVNFGSSETFQDRVTITPKEFLEKLARGNLPHPSTSAPGIGAYETVYERHPDSPIIPVLAGSRFSAIYNTAVLAIKETDVQRIFPFDSETTSLGLGFMAMCASLWAKEQLSVEEIMKRLKEMKERVTVAVSLQTLEFVKKGGRANHLSALVGTMLSVKPILTVQKNELKIYKALIRKRSESLKELVALAKNSLPLEMVGVVYAGAEEVEREAQDIAQRISEFYTGIIYKSEIGPALIAHTGPGAIGLVFVREYKPTPGVGVAPRLRSNKIDICGGVVEEKQVEESSRTA